MSKEVKKCPRCKKTYTEPSAISRKDNKTKICPQCGTDEALREFAKYYIQDCN